MMRKLGLICSLAFALLFSSSLASAQDAASAKTYAGVVLSSRVDDMDQPVRVGAVMDGERFMLFFCGNGETVAQRTHWFVSGPDGKLQDKSDWQVWIVPGEEMIWGAVKIPNVGSFYWVAERAQGDVGLYRAKNELGTLGVIVTDLDGNGELELQGALKVAGTEVFSQIVPVSSKIEVVGGELEVNVPDAGGGVSKAIVKRVDVLEP